MLYFTRNQQVHLNKHENENNNLVKFKKMSGGLNKNVLVIGSGGREHAICWKLQLSDKVNTIYAFPGSAGISQVSKVKIVTELSLKDFKVIIEFPYQNDCSNYPPYILLMLFTNLYRLKFCILTT